MASASAIRAVIHAFIKKRLDDKLESLTPDNPSRAVLTEKYAPSIWLADAAARAGQLKAVTHSLKPIHPDAKGTNVFAPPAGLPRHEFIGTSCLAEDFDLDVVGNAAALDVYKLLQNQVEGTSLLAMSVNSSPEFAQALSDNPVEAENWMREFASLTEPSARMASHTNAKQLYWPVGEDLHQDANFHLLAPLLPYLLGS